MVTVCQKTKAANWNQVCSPNSAAEKILICSHEKNEQIILKEPQSLKTFRLKLSKTGRRTITKW